LLWGLPPGSGGQQHYGGAGHFLLTSAL